METNNLNNGDTGEQRLKFDDYSNVTYLKIGGDATRTSTRFIRSQLGDAIRGGIPEPEEFEPDILLKGASHLIFTGPEQGKTWLAVALIARALERGQTAMFFDMENGPRIISERLQDLGITGDTVDAYLEYYHVPSMDMSVEAREEYVDLLDSIKPDLLVFDSWIGFLAACGFDENVPTHIEQWANAYVHPAKARGCTIIILDHVPHGDATRSRGATRKKDMVDVQWHLEKSEDFNRDKIGYIRLTLTKDREAWLPERVGFSIGGTEDGFIFRRSEGMATQEKDKKLPPSAIEADRALKTFGNKGATYTQWIGAIVWKGAQMGDSTFRTARNKLLSDDVKLVIQDGNLYYSTTAVTANEQQLLQVAVS